jgi:hypothetical protein
MLTGMAYIVANRFLNKTKKAKKVGNLYLQGN